MLEIALKLIRECYETQNQNLDLGRCGLRDEHFAEGSPVDIALRKCTHLKSLVLSNEWRDHDTRKRVYSTNIGSENKLTILPPALPRLSRLSELICAGDATGAWGINDMSSLAGLCDLCRLNLSFNKIESIKGLGSLINLQFLNISSNLITEIKGLDALTALQKLFLYINQITEIKGLETLTALHVLDLFDNQITEIKGLSSLSVLKELDLSCNEITEIKGLDALINLRELNIFNNRITEITGLGPLSSLEQLNLSINKISEIKSLEGLTNLKFLNISSNRIMEIKGLDSLTALHVLELYDNEIAEIKGLDTLAGLQELILHKNKITAINGLGTLTALLKLQISENRIREVKGVDTLRSLHQIDLSSNQITEIKGLNTLVTLQQINIGYNWIQDISPLLIFLQQRRQSLRIVNSYSTNIGEINVRNNPLITPPVEIVHQGNEAVIHYFEELEKQGADYLYEAKLLIVGQPRAGKTSLRYKLLDGNAFLPEEDKTTRGIDIDRISFDTRDKGGNLRKFHYNVWDFGGQQIYQTTHQFFLTHRSLYILVIDTGNDKIGNDDATVNYWLQAVELLGGNSPLLLVQNEKNGRTIHLDLPQKRTRFSFLKENYQVDLNALIPGTATYNEKRKNDFDDLKQDIETALNRLPLVGFPMPKNWVKIREELQAMSTTFAYISLDKYKEICSRFEVADYERQLELSRIFHDLGVFLHFQDYGILDDFIVLQNTWATDAVFVVLDNGAVKQNKGRFTDNDLPGIWETKGYNKAVHKRLLGLMMKFELCYQVDKTRPYTYIVPEMLPDCAADGYNWYPNNDLPLQYKYDFMPRGLLTRLIVRLNRNIYRENDQQLVWKTGVIVDGNLMDCPNTFAEITEAWDSKQLTIRIQGKFSKDLMCKITHEIDELNKDYFKQMGDMDQVQKSKWYKMIPCNCVACEEINDKHFYDYSELLERKEYGKDTIECKKRPFATVNIDDLLEGVFMWKENTQSKYGTDRKHHSDAGRASAKNMFISYSKDDIPLVNKFIEHLAALQLDGKVAHWYCTELTAGTDWHDEIQGHFDQSDMVVFMVSPNFMKTRYIHEHEIKKAFERKVKDPGFKIVPIILDFCKWTTAHNNLGQFTALPYTARPVVDFSNQNMAWYIIQECLRLLIEKDLQPVGEDFYSYQALPKDVLRLMERIVTGKVEA